MNDLIKRYSSRKFIAAIATSLTAWSAAAADGVYTTNEILLIVAPIIAFILMEGAADVATRYTNIPTVDEESPSFTESETKS